MMNSAFKQEKRALFSYDWSRFYRVFFHKKGRVLKINMEINPEITCQICFEKAPPNKPFHRHYGAICCVKCRSFFRRIVQINGVEADLRNVYQCISRQPNLRCDMQLFGTTHRCLHCRMEKCLEVGLRPDRVLLDKKARRKYTGMESNICSTEFFLNNDVVIFAYLFGNNPKIWAQKW